MTTLPKCEFFGQTECIDNFTQSCEPVDPPFDNSTEGCGPVDLPCDNPADGCESVDTASDAVTGPLQTEQDEPSRLCCYYGPDARFQPPERTCPSIFSGPICEKPPHLYQHKLSGPYNQCRHASFKLVRRELAKEFDRGTVNEIMQIENGNFEVGAVYETPKGREMLRGKLSYREALLLSTNPAHRAKADRTKIIRPDPEKMRLSIKDLDRHLDNGLYASAYVRTRCGSGIHVVTIFKREDRVIDGETRTVYLFTDPGSSIPTVYEFVWNEDVGALVKFGNPYATLVKDAPYIYQGFIPYRREYLYHSLAKWLDIDGPQLMSAIQGSDAERARENFDKYIAELFAIVSREPKGLSDDAAGSPNLYWMEGMISGGSISKEWADELFNTLRKDPDR